MNWINVYTRCVSTLLITTLVGCTTANQETILPPSKKMMIDIYREAIDAAGPETMTTIDPVAMCASVMLDEQMSEDACQRVLTKHISAAYQQLDVVPQRTPIDYVAYTRTAETELENLFPRLENPDLVIYVYPHLATRTRAPIPGYTTVIPLYNRVEYRLPGESLLRTADAPEATAAQETQP